MKRTDRPLPRARGAAAKAFTAIAIALAVLTVLGLYVLWPRGFEPSSSDPESLLGPRTTLHAAVVSSEYSHCDAGSATGPLCEWIRVEIKEGDDAGHVIGLQMPDIPATPELRSGDPIFVAQATEVTQGNAYFYVDRDRSRLLLALGLLFVAFVLVLGRWRGLMAILGLGGSIAVLLLFVLPAILAGHDPLAVAVVACAAIAFLALYLAQGFSTATTIALLGTFGGLLVAIVSAQLAVAVARFTGFSNEQAFLLSAGAQTVDLSGLILAGIIIGALGAIDDMTVTQVATVSELRAVSPDRSRRDLFRSAMRVGRDHIASTVNTLVLAYAGASLPLLLLFVITQQSWTSVVSGEAVAVEIVRTLAGSLGLVAAVPITTALAAVAFAPQEEGWDYEGVDLLGKDDGPLFPGASPAG